MKNVYIKPFLMLATLIILTVLVAKAQIKLPTIKEQKPNKVTLSTLMVQQKKTAEQAYQKLHKRFSGVVKKKTNAKTNNDWQLHGIVKTGRRYFALIRQQGKLTRYEAGGVLLDYGTITAIHDNGISVSTAKKIEEYRLYKNSTQI